MELKKCCNHPYLFPNCEEDEGGEDDEEKLSQLIEVR